MKSHRLGLLLSAGFLSVLAGVVGCAGVVVAFTLSTSNGNTEAALAGVAYVLTAFGAPVGTGIYLVRSRRWDGLRAVRVVASGSLLVHAALVPVALASLGI